MLPHENGDTPTVSVEIKRLVFALILFLLMLKYGLSTSPAVVRFVMRRRVPAGVR